MRRIPVIAWFALTACTAAGTTPRNDPDAGGEVTTPDASPPLMGTCAESDRDGDGVGTDPSCAVIDCDDSNLAIHPGAFEACNGLDDDCDRDVDEDLGSSSCGSGACRRSVPNCENGRPVACTPGGGNPEVCNREDDDCNGIADDGITGASCGTGACARTVECVDGVMGMCIPGPPGNEECNRADDNCDGEVDEGFRARVDNGTYTTLRGFHSGCDGAGQRMGPDCNAAINRYCQSTGCTTAGFGPLENSGDISVVGCVAADPGHDVAYATLATFHPPCDGATERIGPNCNAAIHRYCQSIAGYTSGFGPGESGAASVLVTCLRAGAATVVNTTYTELRNHHDGCNGTTGRYGPDCNAAINRWCGSNGYATGYGPVENGGDTAVITCVSP